MLSSEICHRSCRSLSPGPFPVRRRKGAEGPLTPVIPIVPPPRQASPELLRPTGESGILFYGVTGR